MVDPSEEEEEGQGQVNQSSLTLLEVASKDLKSHLACAEVISLGWNIINV